jgi:hypothetical protein
MSSAQVPADDCPAGVIEKAAGRAHAAWLAERGRQVDRQSPRSRHDDGGPHAVPYERLPEPEREVDRAVVRAALATLAGIGVEAAIRLPWPPQPGSGQVEDLVLYQGGRVDVCVRRRPGASVDGYVYTRWYGDRAIVASPDPQANPYQKPSWTRCDH